MNKVSNEEFAELFIDKKLPVAYRDLSKCDFNSSFQDAIDKGSKGAKRVINFLSKLKMIRKDPSLINFIRTASMRQIYCGASGRIKRHQMEVFIDLLNDKHININFIRLLLLLSKMA